jgi:hypothetical protein
MEGVARGVKRAAAQRRAGPEFTAQAPRGEAMSKRIWRWIHGEEAREALNGAKFGARIATRDRREIDGLATRVMAPWMTGAWASPGALPGVAHVEMAASPAVTIGPDGEPRLERGVLAPQPRAVCALIEEVSGCCFAIALKAAKGAFDGLSLDELDARLGGRFPTQGTSKDWSPMPGLLMGPKGEMRSPREQEAREGGDGDASWLAKDLLSDLGHALAGGFGAFQAQIEALEVERSAQPSGVAAGAPQRRTAPRV